MRTFISARLKINLNSFYSNIQKTDSCWIWLSSKDRMGYGYCDLSLDNKNITRKTHRISYCLHHQNYDLLEQPFNKFQVLHHTCNNKICCNPDHLILMSGAENSTMAGLDNLMPYGEKHRKFKLTTNQVTLIRTVPMKDSYYSNLFNVSESLIEKIRLGTHRRKG
jgi:hypothetical protein